jgi:hypothetical protein
MPLIRFNDQPVRLQLNPDDALTVVAPIGSTVRVVEAADPSAQNPNATITGTTTILGPYGVIKTLDLTCTGGIANWSVKSARVGSFIVSPNAPVDGDGRPDGTVWIQV